MEKQTVVSMKLKANNFTGYLPDGKRYKVTTEETRNFISSIIWFYRKELGTWWCEDVFSEHISPSYTQALKKSLTRLEKQYGIELIKRDPKLKISA